MTQQYIQHNGKKYEVKEPTIAMWANVMKLKDILEPEELNIRLISEITGMSKEDIMSCDAKNIQKIGEIIYRLMNMETKEVQMKIELNGVKYEMTDFYKISFGQFVDIDSFLSKDETYKVSNLNELAAYLYIEEGKKYGEIDFKKKIEEFKDLPVKYVEGAVFFLLSLGKGLQQLTQVYSKSKFLWMMMKVRMALLNIGDGTLQYLTWPKTWSGRLTMLLLSPLLLVSIILHILWISIKSKKKI